jgi:hypothetical protein
MQALQPKKEGTKKKEDEEWTRGELGKGGRKREGR